MKHLNFLIFNILDFNFSKFIFGINTINIEIQFS